MIQLDHIGIAVADLTAMQKLFQILGLSITNIENVPDQGVAAHFIPLPQTETKLELLVPLKSGDGTVAQFMTKRGPGIHHLSFRVGHGELEPISQKLIDAGYRLIYPTPKNGAHQRRINFIHPSSAGGILIEIME